METFKKRFVMMNDSKRIAAEKAVEWIQNDMIIGLGTGSTAFWAIQKIGELVKRGLRIGAVATSIQSENLAKQVGIPIIPFGDTRDIDVTIDGADEIDPNGYLIKGGGGALLREKIVAYHTKTYLIVADQKKLVEQLGTFPLPIEIVSFGRALTIKKLENEFGTVKIRQAESKDFVTDNGHLIADLHCYPISDPEAMNTALHLIPGVVETGLFMKELISKVIVGHNDGKLAVKNFNQSA